MKLNFFFAALFCLYFFTAFAQNTDTVILSFADFIKTVKENHPVSRQSELLVQSADAGILAARGNFDPRLYYNIDQKYFNDKNYWTLQNGSIKIPTLIGLELNTGVEQSFGSYLNNESITSTNGLAYSQFSMPLLQGLLIDERRYAMKNAKLFRELSFVEQKNLINELYSKAAKTYWEWVQAYYNTEVQRESVLLAKQRLEGVKQAALLGDNAAIDTLEASIQHQDRSVTLQQQEMDFYSKTLMLSVFIWNEKNDPLQITANTIPPKVEELLQLTLGIDIFTEIDSLIASHPNILTYQNKNSRLALDLKLKQDKLKPVLNVKFNPLYDLGNLNSSILYGVNSFKWGVGFQFPLLLRKERGEIKMAKIKMADLKFELQNKKAEITNKIRASFNEYSNTEKQALQYETIVQNYYQLLLAERKLFEIGESSIFMVNNRELSYINSKLKLNDLQFKSRKAGVEMLYNSGQFYNIQ